MKLKYKSLEKIHVSRIVGRVWLITFIIIIVFISILFLPWQQNIKGYGELVALYPKERPYKIYSPINGFVEKFYVGEDVYVKKGDLLVKIVDLDKQYLNRLENALKSLKKQLDIHRKNLKILEQKKNTLKEKEDIGIKVYENKEEKIRDKIKQLNNKKISLEKNFEISQINYYRTKKLYKEGLESKRKLELEENKYTKAKVDLKNVNLEINIYEKELKIIQNEKEKFKRDMKAKILEIDKQIQSTLKKIEDINQKLIKTKSKISKYKTSIITAKEDGYVIRIFKSDKNQYIKKGEPVLLFSPKPKSRAVLVKFRPVDMPLVKEGLPVRIQFEGWPALQISGWPKINVGTFDGHIGKVDPLAYEKNSYYAFVVEDYPGEWPQSLKIGTKATVWVRLSIVPIWYEIWRQINAFPPVMVNPQKEEKK